MFGIGLCLNLPIVLQFRQTLLNMLSLQKINLHVCQVAEGQPPGNVKQGRGSGGLTAPLPPGPEVPELPIPGLFTGSAGGHANWQVSPPLTWGRAPSSLFFPCFPAAHMLLLPFFPSLSSSDYAFYKNCSALSKGIKLDTCSQSYAFVRKSCLHNSFTREI